mmetsp:Transcript_28248/g.51594  ORF Transcript_28248/g.51594 Transcript_28248/m.51594 type:complete len:204 (+) Transcript_28248:340-951(+)
MQIPVAAHIHTLILQSLFLALILQRAVVHSEGHHIASSAQHRSAVPKVDDIDGSPSNESNTSHATRRQRHISTRGRTGLLGTTSISLRGLCCFASGRLRLLLKVSEEFTISESECVTKDRLYPVWIVEAIMRAQCAWQPPLHEIYSNNAAVAVVNCIELRGDLPGQPLLCIDSILHSRSWSLVYAEAIAGCASRLVRRQRRRR